MKNKIKSLPTAKDILKIKRVWYVSEDDTLASAESKFSSSHDSVVVVDSEHKLLGIVSPYYTAIKRHYPPATKIKRCLFHSPKIQLDTPIDKIAHYFLETKIHDLPVIDEAGMCLGIVTARRALMLLKKTELVNIPVREMLVDKDYLMTININSKLDEAIRFFIRTKLSKLVVVNEHNNIQGMLSIFDILPIYREPRVKENVFDRKGDGYSYNSHRVQEYMIRNVVTVEENATIGDVLDALLDKQIGSVIVMKNKLEPLNIITTSDLLRFFIKN
ncbi:MAG: CBS domain-containing protein [Candidatus Roizmanbacteria bacterium]|nr:CBS domain-containing protein [Candidatus Roizmanbacteria bacterium]